MYKACPQHGEFNVYLWPDMDYYRWFNRFTFPVTPRVPQTESTEVARVIVDCAPATGGIPPWLKLR